MFTPVCSTHLFFFYIYRVFGINLLSSILLFFRLAGSIVAHYASFESLDPPSFIFVTCIMVIHANSDQKFKGTLREIIDGLHTVQRTFLVSCRLNFPKLLWFSDVCPVRMMLRILIYSERVSG